MAESKMDPKEYALLLEQFEAETKNLWITDVFVDTPCRPICLCYLWLVICLIISGAAQFMVPSLGGDRDYALWDNDV